MEKTHGLFQKSVKTCINFPNIVSCAGERGIFHVTNEEGTGIQTKEIPNMMFCPLCNFEPAYFGYVYVGKLNSIIYTGPALPNLQVFSGFH